MTLKQKTLIVTVAGIAAILLSGFAQFWTGKQIDSAWNQLTTQASPREKLLEDIEHQFGYGGIIHNFKNYVLRGQSKYIDRIVKNGDKILDDIKEYKELNLTKEEIQALELIKLVMLKYTGFIPTVKKMWENGATPANIDKTVKINDGPAFKGFKVLNKHFSAIAESANENMNAASTLQFVLLVSTFLLLSGVIVFAVIIQRSQTATIDNLSRTMTDIEQSRNFSRRIHDGRTDEVGALTSTFDKLLADIESMLALNRAVLDAVPDPIFLEKEGKVAFGNVGAANYAGVSIKELQGMAGSKVLIRADDQSASAEYITCIKNGEKVILDEIVKEVTDKQGKNLGRLVVARDVTLIIKREAEAEASLKMIRNVGVEINNAAQELVGATESLTSRIQIISEGAQTQQERTSETASAMEEMNATVLDVARNAGGAAELAEQTRKKAIEGADVVTQAIGAISSVSERADSLKKSMGNLADHTQSIGAIIGVINDIADQTNLLALNAAIEAARAGEAGRGFAVVADEVRKLAEKTMVATKDVAQAIDAIQSVANQNIKGMDSAVEAVGEATELAGQSGEALKAIVQLVEGTTQQVHSIATAAEEQSASSEEIKNTISEVNNISNQTAEGMRESTSAIRDLADLAQRLEELAAKAG